MADQHRIVSQRCIKGTRRCHRPPVFFDEQSPAERTADRLVCWGRLGILCAECTDVFPLTLQGGLPLHQFIQDVQAPNHGLVQCPLHELGREMPFVRIVHQIDHGLRNELDQVGPVDSG